MNDITIDGKHYYQSYRACNRPLCSCRNGGPKHGPYWYCYDRNTARTSYVGKTLPPDVADLAAQIHDLRHDIAILIEEQEMIAAQAQANADALRHLVTGQTLTNDAKERIAALLPIAIL